MKKYLKMNNNNNQLSLGNLCRLVKEKSSNKKLAGQTDIFCTLFAEDNANDSTVNNYCIGYRSIGTYYKEIYFNNKIKYQKNKATMVPILSNLINLLEGNYQKSYNIHNINQNQKFENLCLELYNIAKNDSSVPQHFTKHLHNLLIKNTYFECFSEILFFIILEKKQPIYVENIVKETIENILNNTNISLTDLETFLTLQLNDGLNYIHSLKKLANKKNPYASFELALMEYHGEFTGTPRYYKCYEYLKTAASYNHPRANYLIAKMLLDQKIGTHSKEDIEIAYQYLKTAESLGSIAALNQLGLFYLNHNHDLKTALLYFQKASEKNYPYAYNNLGKIYEEKKDYHQAFTYYSKSADLEESWACNKVGEFYRLGIGTNKDLKKAFIYYNTSLEMPISLITYWAKYNLAKYFYLTGNYEANIEQDLPLALSLLKDASNHNLILATIELITYYTNKYFKEKKQEDLIMINNLLIKLEQHPNYNLFYKNQVENIIKQIKEPKKIDRTLLT